MGKYQSLPRCSISAKLSQSDTAPSPLSAGMAIEAVSEALAKAREDGPWGKWELFEDPSELDLKPT